MTVSTFNKVNTIVVSLSSANSNNIVTIYETLNARAIASEWLPNDDVIAVNSFIKNLRAYAEIKSLPEAKLPDFKHEDSETDKLYKTLDIEWGSPRKQLNLYLSKQSGQWYPVGAMSLLNPSSYPYRIYNLMDLYTDNLAIELGEDGRLGIGMKDAGWGLLSSNDVLTIHGSYTQEITSTDKPKPTISQSFPHGWDIAPESIMILAANAQRKYFTLVNEGNYPVYLNFGNSAISNQGISLMPHGGSYEYNGDVAKMTASVHAVASGGFSRLAGIECV